MSSQHTAVAAAVAVAMAVPDNVVVGTLHQQRKKLHICKMLKRTNTRQVARCVGVRLNGRTGLDKAVCCIISPAMVVDGTSFSYGFYDTYLYDFIVCTRPALLHCVRVFFFFRLLFWFLRL